MKYSVSSNLIKNRSEVHDPWKWIDARLGRDQFGKTWIYTSHGHAFSFEDEETYFEFVLRFS